MQASMSKPDELWSPSSAVVRVNGLEMHYLESGSGTPVVLLHGFPDHAATWQPLAQRLATSCRVIAPDLRGYRQTTAPREVDAYRIETLVADIAALLDRLDLHQPLLCGHDWGGVLAFAFARQYPDRISGLVALNAPPIEVLQDMIWHDPAQRAASYYIELLRSADADAIFAEAECEALIERFLGEPFRRGVLSADEVAVYRAAWSRPGAWQAMLAWYRASPLELDVPPVTPAMLNPINTANIRCPVQLIWGDRDGVFVPAMADRIMAVCDNGRLHRLPEAGHVPHRDEPDLCASLIATFLTNHARSSVR